MNKITKSLINMILNSNCPEKLKKEIADFYSDITLLPVKGAGDDMYYSWVDNEDYLKLKRYKWRTRKKYATADLPMVNYKRGKLISLHRLVLNNPKSDVDHINGNTLDNRKANLRLCSMSQNLANRGKTIRNTSGYKGVYWNKRARKWQAYITKEGRRYYLGLYENIRKAALAYNKKAITLFGEFARINHV